MKKILPGLLSLFILAACINKTNNKTREDNSFATKSGSTTTSATTMYYGGDILTMEGEQPNYAEVLVTENGKIVYTSSKADAESKYGGAAKVDLQGKTLAPGFVDGHAHFLAFGPQAVGAMEFGEPVSILKKMPKVH